MFSAMFSAMDGAETRWYIFRQGLVLGAFLVVVV